MKYHFLFCFVASVSPLWAQDDLRTPFCNEGTLKGTYAVSINGTRPAPSILPAFAGMPPGTIEMLIGVFLLNFDGRGTQRSYGLTLKGSLSGLFPAEGGSGPYTVNADCTGSFNAISTGVPFPLVNRMVIFSGGREFRSVVSSPQAVMVRAVGRKLE